MRLTRKEKSFDFDDNNEIHYFDEYVFPDHSKVCDAIDKLGQLEDIEDELGIDLITLFKALKNGVYEIKDNNEVFHTSIRGIGISDLYAIWNINIPECDYSLEYKDYGKTWALTKEELL